MSDEHPSPTLPAFDMHHLLTADNPDLPIPLDNADKWRSLPPSKRTMCSHRNIESFGNFTPTHTDGVVALVIRINSTVEIIQLSAISWPERERISTACERTVRKARKPSLPARLASLTLSDIL